MTIIEKIVGSYMIYEDFKELDSENVFSYHDNSEVGAHSNELSELSEKNKESRGEYTSNEPRAPERMMTYPYNAISSPLQDLSTDPAGTINGLNLDRMVRNNPISLQDSDGRAPDEDLLSKEGKRLAKGHISPLAKRGLLTGKSSSPIGLTFDAVRVDSKIPMTEARPYNSNDKDFRDKIITSSGIEVTSLESGTGQVGDYWDKHHLGSDVSLINVVNGEAGTIGIRIPLSAIEEKKPIVITSGGLSGCTMLFAHDQQYFYAYHTGQSNPSEWRTGVGGVETTAESHRLLTGKDPGELESHNNSLISLFDSYESAHITYFGKEGTKITENSEKVLTSDYNSFKSFDPAIGYAYALLARVGNKVKIKTLSEETHIPKPGKLNFKSSAKTKNSVILS
ncbi:cytotoxic necrotizing factor Rho-activating domain-containing protein [Xenorhabdus bovienii]|uniref:cytotoxic necrotizing factor Rho-activating domain-containing protein n=1 Tax=Xenorhabdus bovienii TaxID=40576 RepID=UPI00237CD326|nr:cytotoxic necrotizing factor Rho-activating domain-containing protein [Xenorhabdus bovienii]MDE1480961.1 hypothetical protein [Xenorhabdus bovienii]MDE9461876.1 hypothetical protein [Xenorhabdus bovienii]MDE9469005.1 hypothetical protein [Xenorhabdus bovienii]